jgi:hypothetical protein
VSAARVASLCIGDNITRFRPNRLACHQTPTHSRNASRKARTACVGVNGAVIGERWLSVLG